MRSNPEKVVAVIAAMRDAGGNKERFTAGWIELSCTHKGLHDALKAIFHKRPTTQRLGVLLAENVGTQSGEFVLLGRHNTNAKAWRYAVRKTGELEEMKAAKEAARNTGPSLSTIIQVQAPQPERAVVSIHNPYMIEGALAPDHLTTTRVTDTGRIVHTPVIGRDGMPVPAVPEAKAPEAKPDAVISRNLSMPPWIQEGRSATRAEWDEWQRDRAPVRLEVHEHVRNMTSDETGGYYNGVGGVTQPNGVYIPPANDRRDGWRQGGPNWRQKL